MKKIKQLVILMLALVMLAFSTPEAALAADNTSFAFNSPKGSIYVLMRTRDVNVSGTVIPLDSLTISGTESCKNFQIYTVPYPSDQSKTLEIDCHLFKTSDKTVFDLPDGEYYLLEFFDPSDTQVPSRFYSMLVDSTATEPIMISAHSSAFTSENGPNGFSFSVTTFEDLIGDDVDLTGLDENTAFFINVENTAGERLEDIIVNLELEDPEKNLEVVERVISGSNGRAVFQTNLAGKFFDENTNTFNFDSNKEYKGQQCVVSITDSAEYITPVTLDLSKKQEDLKRLQRCISKIIGYKKAILIRSESFFPVEQTSDLAYIEGLLKNQFLNIYDYDANNQLIITPKTPEDMFETLADFNQASTLVFKDYESSCQELKAAVRWAESSIITLDKKPTHPVFFKKTDIAGKELAGAEMELFKKTPTLDGSGNVVEIYKSVEKWTSDDTPKTMQITEGDYKLHEEIAPNNYALAEDVEFTVDANGTLSIKAAHAKIENGNTIVMVDDYKTEPQEGEKVPSTGDGVRTIIPLTMFLLAFSIVGIAGMAVKNKKEK